MKILRIFFAFLLVIPIGLGLNYLSDPGKPWPENATTGEILFLTCGLPILLLNYWAWESPEVIERMFLGQPKRKAKSLHVFCTHCSARKDETESLLPANKRYISERILRVEEMANQDGLRFWILSGEFGLIESDQPIPWYDHLLVPDEVPALVDKVVAQLAEKNIKQIDYYARSVEVDQNNAPYTNTMEAACAKAGVKLSVHLFE